MSKAQIAGENITSFTFVVTPENLEICLTKGVCGCLKHEKAAPEARGLADICGIRPGSQILLYEIGTKAIYGIFRAKSFPFYDETPIWSSIERLYPYRVLIDTTVHTFKNPIFLSDLYDLRDKDMLWSWREVVRRPVHPFTDAECSEFLRLLFRNNISGPEPSHIEEPYTPRKQEPLPIQIINDTKGRIVTPGAPGAPEGYLTAWFMSQLAERKFKEFFGEYSDYINFMPTSYGKEIDVLLLNEIKDHFYHHQKTRASCTIVELKVDRCEKQDLTQTLKYEDWLIKKKCDGDSAMVHSTIVANRFDAEVVDYVKKKADIEGKAPQLLEYSANKGRIELSTGS